LSLFLSGSSLLSAGGGILSTGEGGGDGYTIEDAVADLPFAFNSPTDPTITSNESVTTGTLATHISTAGARLTLASGSYGDRTFSSSDQEIILQSGATLGHVTVSGDRIKFRGETARVGSFASLTLTSAASDVHFHECTITGDGGGSSSDDNFINGADRVAFIGCAVTMGSYAFYIDNGANDIVFGNCNIVSTGVGGDPTLRFMSVNRAVTRDSRLVGEGAASVHRIHANTGEGNSADHYVFNNQLEGHPGQIQPDSTGGGSTATLDNVQYHDNEIYGSGGGENWGSMGDSGERATNLIMTGNTLYSTGGAFPPELEVSWDISGNTVSATTTAPAWSFQ
jgi:hypothetical protein